MLRSLRTVPPRLLVDVLAPLVLFYALRAAGADARTAIVVSAIPPGVRVTISWTRTREVDVVGVLVLASLATTLAVSVVGGSPRALLVRNALAGLPFAGWMAWSARRPRPLPYELVRTVLPADAAALQRRFAESDAVRRTWRRLALFWALGLLLYAAVTCAMAATLPVDLVPGLEAAVGTLGGVTWLLVSGVALHRAGTLPRRLRRPEPAPDLSA